MHILFWIIALVIGVFFFPIIVELLIGILMAVLFLGGALITFLGYFLGSVLEIVLEILGDIIEAAEENRVFRTILVLVLVFGSLIGLALLTRRFM
jgi:hypothetical protein